MKLDTGLSTRNLRDVPAAARAAEQAGFDAVWIPEAGNDGFLPAALIAEHTKQIKMGTSVAIAFPRSPMITAGVAWDLAGVSEGRFVLGLQPGQRSYRAALQHQVGSAGSEAARVYRS